MEVGVRLIGIILRFLNLLLTPISWLKSRNRKTVPPPQQPVLMWSAKRIAEAIRSGEHTSEEIVSIYIDRVKEVNPYIHAVVDERYRAALDEAKNIDRQIQEARKDGTIEELFKNKPLLGVPFTVKESCLLAGLSASVGCMQRAGARAVTDGAATRLARAAGGVPLLVSNTPELCLGWESANLLRDSTNNPYDLARTPAGSSGGEAALVASGASPFGVSSDIAGSIRLPAAFCGVFGHKPTPGIIPIEGHIPTLNDEQFPKFLTIGPITKHAEDLPLLLKVMAGENASILNLDTPVDMKKVKVCYMTEATKSIALIPVQQCIQDAILNSVRYLEKECGCTVSEEKFDLENSVEISVSVFFSMKDISNMLQDTADPKSSPSVLVELSKHCVGGASRSLQALGFSLIHSSNLLIRAASGPRYKGEAARLKDEFVRVLGTDGVFIYPVFNELAHHHNQVFVRASGVLYPMLFNVLGLPAAAVPLGLHNGLPVAVQVIAAPYQDRLCVAVARELEKGFGGWRPPR